MIIFICLIALFTAASSAQTTVLKDDEVLIYYEHVPFRVPVDPPKEDVVHLIIKSNGIIMVRKSCLAAEGKMDYCKTINEDKLSNIIRSLVQTKLFTVKGGYRFSEMEYIRYIEIKYKGKIYTQCVGESFCEDLSKTNFFAHAPQEYRDTVANFMKMWKKASSILHDFTVDCGDFTLPK